MCVNELGAGDSHYVDLPRETCPTSSWMLQRSASTKSLKSAIHQPVRKFFCFFFWMKRAHHVPPFPRVADTNEPSFITVIKPAGRLFLHVAAPPLNERLSPWAMADFQGALWAALRLHGHRSINKAHWFSLQYLLASIFRVQFNQCVLLLCI